ncbi:calcium channel flower homolog [Amphiura filiformis]|uniref:calcium channel flower homolog n=1 Tax=Amphiura filiformis TaxID=82378 RepID=UPI003B20C379
MADTVKVDLSGVDAGTPIVNTRTAPQPEPVRQPEVGTFTRFAIRCVAAVLGIVCAINAFVVFLSGITSPLCIVAGIYMILLFILVEMFEAPICCQFFEFTNAVNSWSERQKSWVKALIYLLLPIVGIGMCPGLSTILGCGAVMVIGVLYGLIFIGKKGDAVQQAHVRRAGGGDNITLTNNENQ